MMFLGSLAGFLSGVAQDGIKLLINRNEKIHEKELEIQKIKELNEHAFELDKKRAELNIELSNTNLQKTQLEYNIRQQDALIASEDTEQKYIENITKATLEPFDYDIVFLKPVEYSDNKAGNVVAGIVNLLYGIVNSCIGLCSIVKFSKEIINITRPLLSFISILSVSVVIYISFINIEGLFVGKDGLERWMVVIESYFFLAEYIITFWFYGRRSEKMGNIFQKKN